MHLSAQWLISALLKEVIMPSIPLVVINDYKIPIIYQQLTHSSNHTISASSPQGADGSRGNVMHTIIAFFCIF